MTAAAAVEGIRELDSTGGIGLISAESDPPYDRPPLSRDFGRANLWTAFGVRRRTKEFSFILAGR